MTRVSTGELISRLTPAVPTEGSPDVIAPLPNGQLVRAEVIRLLSDNLLTLAFPGGTLQARSEVPVSAGDKLLLEVNRDTVGTTSLRLVTREPNLPDSASVRQATLPVTSSLVATNPERLSIADAAVDKLAGLIKPGGAVEQLIRSRPELADRLERILQSTTQRPTESLGDGISSLQREVTRLVDQLPTGGEAKSGLQQTVRRVAEQLIADRSLADPPKLASNLLNQVVALAKGLESTLSTVINPPAPAIATPSVTPATPTSGPANETQTPAATSLDGTRNLADQASNRSVVTTVVSQSTQQVLLSAIQELSSAVSRDATSASAPSTLGTDATRVLSTHSTDGSVLLAKSSADSSLAGAPSAEPLDSAAKSSTESIAPKEATLPTSFRGVLESDLKGQLLELRGRLESLAGDSPSPALSASIARTDRLIEQLTSQQIRNVDGLNQYFSVSLPIDPKTGVSQAQLQAFYRKGEGGRVPSLDDSSRFTVALFLQLSRLGDVLATVTGVEGTVSIALTAENSSTAEQLSRGIEELRSGLEQIGQVGAMITVRERPAPIDGPSATSTHPEDLWGDFIEPTLLAHSAGSRLDREA